MALGRPSERKMSKWLPSSSKLWGPSEDSKNELGDSELEAAERATAEGSGEELEEEEELEEDDDDDDDDDEEAAKEEEDDEDDDAAEEAVVSKAACERMGFRASLDGCRLLTWQLSRAPATTAARSTLLIAEQWSGVKERR